MWVRVFAPLPPDTYVPADLGYLDGIWSLSDQLYCNNTPANTF